MPPDWNHSRDRLALGSFIINISGTADLSSTYVFIDELNDSVMTWLKIFLDYKPHCVEFLDREVQIQS